jgi:hypothetical protein
MTITAISSNQIDTITGTSMPVYDLTSPYSIAIGPGPNSFNGNFQTVSIHDHTYQGQMVTVQHTISEVNDEILKMNMGEFKNMIKKELLHKLLDEIVKNNLIEFTSQTDVAAGQTHYRARLFATPDSQVRLIRKNMRD